jgi:uncharacterized iron-regulated membrane protein
VTARSVRWWSIVHRWTSLVATVFLLLLCLTGLPLIFHHEIDEALGYAPMAEKAEASARRVSVDDIAEAALHDHPGMVLQYIAWEQDQPGIVTAYVNHTVNGKPDDAVLAAYSAYSAKALGLVGVGPMLVVLKLHTDMFAGLPGKLFLGGMGMLFLAAIVSGVVLYWPFTRRLSFGAVRYGGSRRVIWLDWHNLLAIATVVWALVVGATGVVNTWAELLLDRWRATELNEMIASYAGKPLPLHLVSIDRVLANAARAAPETEPAFVAFPGTPFTSPRHFAVFLRGATPLTSRVLQPILLDAETGQVADTRQLPFYLKLLFLSQPLHFGDYAGLPLKIIWALLDVVTIVVIGSGLYLWIARRTRRRDRSYHQVPGVAT